MRRSGGDCYIGAEKLHQHVWVLEFGAMHDMYYL